ncbi:hypothetical protein ACMFMF_005222 [Clarireedia jacksonii]
MLSSSVLTTFGPRLTVFIGTTGYPLFLGGLWYYSTALSPSLLFPLLTGAYIGFSGSLLWTATGFIAYTYSTPSIRGSYLSSQTGIQGAISTLACTIMLGVCFAGSAASERRDSVSGKETQTVPRSVYVVFMVATVAACGLGAGGIVGVERVLGRMRGGSVETGGGVKVEGMKNGKAKKTNFWTEVKDQRKLFTDWRVMILTVPFLAGEMGGFVIFSSLNATARSAGYARGCIAAGQAIMFGVEAAGVRQLFIIILGFAFQGVGLLCMGLVCWVCMGVVVKDESVEGDGSRSEPEEFGGDCLDEGSEKARDRNDVMLI